MDEQITQIAERLRGLRDVLELTADDIARDCDISAEEYRLAETGEFDISVSMLQKIARHYGISLDALMFGQEPKMSSYFLTRAVPRHINTNRWQPVSSTARQTRSS